MTHVQGHKGWQDIIIVKFWSNVHMADGNIAKARPRIDSKLICTAKNWKDMDNREIPIALNNFFIDFQSVLAIYSILPAGFTGVKIWPNSNLIT